MSDDKEHKDIDDDGSAEAPDETTADEGSEPAPTEEDAEKPDEAQAPATEDRDAILDRIIAAGEEPVEDDEAPVDEAPAPPAPPTPDPAATPPPPAPDPGPAPNPEPTPRPAAEASPYAAPSPPPKRNRGSEGTLMLILAYLGPFALIPYLVQPKDPEQRFHARQGLALFLFEVLAGIGFAVVLHVPVLGQILGCLGCVIVPVTMVVLLFLHAGLIFKALDGERAEVPLVRELARRL